MQLRHGRSSRARAHIGAALAIVFATAFAPACQNSRPGTLVPFTDEMRRRLELGDDELRALQFYASAPVVLERVASKGQGRVDRGRLIVRSGTVVHQVVVRPGTPGVIESESFIGDALGGHAIDVSFERGAPLRFGAAGEDRAYTLVDPVQRGFLADLLERFGKPRTTMVDFDGQRWRVVSGADAKLLVERDALGRLDRTHRVLPGVRVR